MRPWLSATKPTSQPSVSPDVVSSMDLAKLTILVLTYNEAPNIARSLAKLGWARQVLVVDSYSTDETLEILGQYENVRVFQRKFDTHALQWNFGLRNVESEWVLTLDADYVLSEGLIDELAQLSERQMADGYYISFKYCVFGVPLRSTILPPRLALFRKASGAYVDDGHTQLLKFNGQFASLNHSIYHDDRKPLKRWLWAQNRYVILEHGKLRDSSSAEEKLQDRLRRAKVVAPLVTLTYCLILRRGVLDGWGGLYYAYQRTLAEVLLALHLIEAEKLGSEYDLGGWLSEQDASAAREAAGHISNPEPRLRRAKVFAPFLSLPYRLLLCGDAFRGWRGWAAAYRRLLSHLLLSLHIIEMKKCQKKARPGQSGADGSIPKRRGFASS